MVALICVIHVCAQDRVITKDGDVFDAYRLDIGGTYIYYTKEDNENADVQKIAKADVLMIKKKDGTKIDIASNISNTSSSQSERSAGKDQSGIIQMKPEDLSSEAKVANEALIAKYNAPYDTNVGAYKKNGAAKSAYMRLGIAENSVLSNEDVEITMETGFLWKENKDAPWILSYNTMWNGLANVGIQFQVRNKTNKTLYMDLGNTFYVSMGQSSTYYTPSSTTTTSSTSSGIGINAGAVAGMFGIGGALGTLANGVNIGGGKTKATSLTTYAQRIVAIPPQSVYKLDPQFVFCDEDKLIYPGFSCALKSATNSYTRWCVLNFSDKSESGEMKEYDVYSYSEQTSPLTMSFVLAYSNTEDFQSTSTIHAGLFLKEIYGNEIYTKMFKSSKIPLYKVNNPISAADSPLTMALMAYTNVRYEGHALLFKVKVTGSRYNTSFPKQ